MQEEIIMLISENAPFKLSLPNFSNYSSFSLLFQVSGRGFVRPNGIKRKVVLSTCFTWNSDKICISAEIAAINWVNKETGQKLIDIHFERVALSGPIYQYFIFAGVNFELVLGGGGRKRGLIPPNNWTG